MKLDMKPKMEKCPNCGMKMDPKGHSCMMKM